MTPQLAPPPGSRVNLLDLDRDLYRPPTDPVLVTVPTWWFLTLNGTGDPAVSPEFQAAVQALYGLAYPLKFALRKAGAPDYAVMPLECLWWADDMSDFQHARRDRWRWTLMIRQPDEVDAALLQQVRLAALAKHPDIPHDRVELEPFDEGECAQVMHVGPYSQEAPTIERLHAFIRAQGYRRRGRHHEIYLGDPRRSAPERLRTVIRQPLER